MRKRKPFVSSIRITRQILSRYLDCTWCFQLLPGSPDLELHWLDEDEGDPETVLESRLKLGALTLNELRGHLGLDPYANAAADRPMVLTPTGYVPIEANAGGQSASVNPSGESTAGKANANAGGRSANHLRKYDPNQPRVPAGRPDGGQWTDEGADSANDLADPLDGGHQPVEQPVQVAGLKCEGFAGGCQSGGSYGMSGMYRIHGRVLCMDCAIKMLGIENEPSTEKTKALEPFLTK